MAIDTAAKRASATNFLLPFYNGVITDGIIDITESVAASWVYNGIDYTVPSDLISETTIDFTLYIDQVRDFTLYIDQVRNFNLEL